MKFVENIEKSKYEKFVENHKTKSHFLQSYDWGEFSKSNKNVTPYYVTLDGTTVYGKSGTAEYTP